MLLPRPWQGHPERYDRLRIEECKPIRVNSIEHNVAWDSAGLEPLLGKTVRLYIMVQDADLYGFRFK